MHTQKITVPNHNIYLNVRQPPLFFDGISGENKLVLHFIKYCKMFLCVSLKLYIIQPILLPTISNLVKTSYFKLGSVIFAQGDVAVKASCFAVKAYCQQQ